MSSKELNCKIIKDELQGVCQDCIYLDRTVETVRKLCSERYIEGLKQAKFDAEMEQLYPYQYGAYTEAFKLIKESIDDDKLEEQENTTMSVLALLNLINVKGTKPHKIKVYEDIYEYDDIKGDYVSIEDKDLFSDSYNIFDILDDDIEIIEDQYPIEYSCTWKGSLDGEMKLIEKLDFEETDYSDWNLLAVRDKINEIIDKLKEMK